MDWQTLSSSSHYKTAVAIKNELQQGNVEEAYAGVKELIEALSRSDRRALKSQLVRLMMSIIKWKSQPEKRSFGWVASIINAREEIMDIQAETPSLTNQVILTLWDKCFQIALRDAQGEMNKNTGINLLSWQEVFEENYDMEDI